MKSASETIDFIALSPEDIKKKLRELCIALTPDEAIKIQKEILKRPPSIPECILWSIQGSEHSSYKSSREHLKQFVTNGDAVILGPSEDAGIVAIAIDKQGHRYGIVVSHESHNHPSQIVPYEGAATGIGGNVRDVSCMGAKVIANADPLRFGDLQKNTSIQIHDGVVSGIAGYSNPIGVPTIAGDVYYDETYNGNCLVNVVSLGVLREDEIIHSKAPKNAVGYHFILVGKPTDNSGFGGASFASLTLKHEEKEQNRGAIQEPNAFLKRHLLKAHYALFKILKEKDLISKVGFKDLGAGGIACASVELAESGGYGAEVNLDLVPLGMENLHPAVILCSETQERYMWVAPPDVAPLILEHYNTTFDLSHIAAGAKAAIIGKIREDGEYIVTAGGNEIVHAPASLITKGLVYQRPTEQPIRSFLEPDIKEPKNYHETFKKIIAHENVACRAPVYEKYDKQVQGGTIIEPGDGDAGVIAPFLDERYPEELRHIGVALTVDQNPRYCRIDPYWGAVNAIVEAAHNIAAVGATPIAATDCLNFGNPEKPEQMWDFVEGVRGVANAAKHLGIPIISGNVSLYNESNGKPIAPSPIISCIGKMNNVAHATTMHFKKSNSLLFLLGERKDECGGSVYYALSGVLGSRIPKPDMSEVEHRISALHELIQNGVVLAAHDISDGGVAVTLAEMSFQNEIGCDVLIEGKLRPDKLLFSESGGFVIEIPEEHAQAVISQLRNAHTPCSYIGTTTKEKRLRMNGLIDVGLEEAKEIWLNGLRKKLK